MRSDTLLTYVLLSFLSGACCLDGGLRKLWDGLESVSVVHWPFEHWRVSESSVERGACHPAYFNAKAYAAIKSLESFRGSLATSNCFGPSEALQHDTIPSVLLSRRGTLPAKQFKPSLSPSQAHHPTSLTLSNFNPFNPIPSTLPKARNPLPQTLLPKSLTVDLSICLRSIVSHTMGSVL